MRAQINAKSNLNKAVILTKAIKKLVVELNLTQEELSQIIGRSKATISRIFNNDVNAENTHQALINPFSKEGQLAILLLRLYRNLDVIFGGNATQCQLWLKSDNNHLEQKPIELMKSVEGLVTVVHYLDAMRGKN